jgi:hypothetical protein
VKCWWNIFGSWLRTSFCSADPFADVYFPCKILSWEDNNLGRIHCLCPKLATCIWSHWQ